MNTNDDKCAKNLNDKKPDKTKNIDKVKNKEETYKKSDNYKVDVNKKSHKENDNKKAIKTINNDNVYKSLKEKEHNIKDISTIEISNTNSNDDVKKSVISLTDSSCAYIDENKFFDGRKVGKYTITKPLGSGSSSSVKQGVNTINGEKVAIKIIKRDYKNAQKKEDRIYREVLISSLLCHPHIVRLKNFYFNERFFFLIFEYVRGTMLLNLVLDEGPLPEKTARRYFRQILSAVGYIHENNIVHRDLKIENILIDENGNVKIVDFGLSNFYDNRRFLETFCGSLYFAAPELLVGKKYLGPEIDVWSVGVILYVLLCGCVPFDDKNIHTLHNKIKEANLIFSKTLSKEAKRLLEGMICNDMGRRFALDDVIKSKWVNIGYNTSVDLYLEDRKEIKIINENLLFILNMVTKNQFPNLKQDIQQYVDVCKRNGKKYEKELFTRKPAISLYYLLLENVCSGDNEIEKGYEDVYQNEKLNVSDPISENMHNFVNFIFEKDKENIISQYFSGSIFKNEESKYELTDNDSLREEFISPDENNNLKKTSKIPKIKNSFIKGFYGGIQLKNLSCQDRLRNLVKTFLEIHKITYEILEKHYLCNKGIDDNYCSFKLSLYRNLILGSYFLSLRKVAGSILAFKELRKSVKEFVEKKIENSRTT
ncbi:Serine/threonine-protein kinase [Conglomerata obtusa]